MTAPIDVLVIDDSATIRKLVELSMRGTAFRPAFAPSGADGVARARAQPPAAILLDCVLPDQTGIDVCRQLAADPRTRTIPILLVTARAPAVREEFEGFPAVVDFVGKPFTGPDLLRRIAAAVGAEAAALPPRFTRDQQERAARILYTHLKDGLALVPSHVTKLGASPPAAFFAKRLLTPEVVAAVLDDLVELFDELRGDGAATAAPVVAGNAVLDRVSGFSERIRHVRLGSTARRVLTLVDGKHALAEIATRLGLELVAIAPVAHELVAAGLLADRTGSVRRPASRPIVILEPDVDGFQQPLASLLESRAEPRALVPVADLDQVVAATRRDRPCLVVVNASVDRSAVGDTARRLRADTALTDVALVAVLDSHDAGGGDDLYSAGFDAVLSKPIIFSDLERYIAPAGAHRGDP